MCRCKISMTRDTAEAGERERGEQSRSDCYSVTIILLATLFGDNISCGVDKICLSLLTGDSFSVIIHIEYMVGALLLFQTRM